MTDTPPSTGTPIENTPKRPVPRSPLSPGVTQHNPYATTSTPTTTSPHGHGFGSRQESDATNEFHADWNGAPPAGAHALSAPPQWQFGQPSGSAVPALPQTMADIYPTNFTSAAPLPPTNLYNMQEYPQQMSNPYAAAYVPQQQVAVPFQQHQQHFNAAPYAPHLQQQYLQAVPQQQQFFPQFQQQEMFGQEPQGQAGPPPPTYEEVLSLRGQLIESSRTANGSSFIQAALKDNADPRNVSVIWAELAPELGDLLLDSHGCYVVKSMMDRLSPQDVHSILSIVAADQQLGFSMCTHSLHTRRVVQHIIENIDGNFLNDLMQLLCVEIATTQQGCIVMQRSMDHSVGDARAGLFLTICSHVVKFACDPFANYVLQHLLEVGDREFTSDALWKSMQGNIIELSCNKFASNVVEKCLFHVTAHVQHLILEEMYSAGPNVLFDMLQDSFGNYIIQSSIALATFRDIGFIDEKLRPVLAHTPYGHKIEARLDRRLKGKPVTARTPLLASGGPPQQFMGGFQQNPHHFGGGNKFGRGGGGRGRGRHMMMHDTVPEGEIPW